MLQVRVYCSSRKSHRKVVGGRIMVPIMWSMKLSCSHFVECFLLKPQILEYNEETVPVGRSSRVFPVTSKRPSAFYSNGARDSFFTDLISGIVSVSIFRMN